MAKNFAAMRRQWAKDHPERMKELQSAWEARNAEARKAYKRDYYKKNRKRMLVDGRKAKMFRLYGITPDEFDTMALAQNGLCKICKQKKPLRIDHCHRTGKVRGLLCHNCNTGLGHFKENIMWLEIAICYLREQL